MQIPGYRIIRKINDGGMSSVYLAVQLSVGREVALKVMSPVLNADPIFSERFQREANIVGQLSHTSIVSIYDIGCHNNLNYIAMDYLPGGTVHDKMKDSLSPAESLTIIKEIAVALQVSHAKGYIHRDLKPDNILFREDGTAVLSDFGVAKAVNAATKVTNSGTVVGTPHYMSPEQSRGLSIDGRSDIYSLGIVFYEMLTGTVPFQAEESIAIAIKHLTAPVPTLPPQFSVYQKLINRMLAKSPDKRFQNGLDLVSAITIIEDTLSGYQSRGTSPTDTNGMTVMTLFKALLLTSYAALRHQLAIWLSKILSWRWTPNRGFFSHPNIKVTEIQTISNTRDEEFKTVISTRIQKAAHYQEIASRKIGTITRGFTIVLIASIIWSSFCVGLTRTNVAYEKIFPEFMEHAITSTANVILGYSTRFTGKDKNAVPHTGAIERVVERSQGKEITELATQTLANNISQPPETPKAIENRSYNYSDATSKDQWRSEFETNITLLGDPNRVTAESDTSEERQSSQNQSAEKQNLEQQNISLEDSTESELINESDRVKDIVREKTTPEETITSETSISKTKETSKPPSFTLTINTAPNDARVRVLNIRDKYTAGMSLNAGRYHIEVSKPGFKTVKQWLRITDRSIFQDYTLESTYKLGDSIVDTLADGSSGPELRIIASGSFTMGNKGQAHTSPEHRVNIGKSFAISQYEVTFAAYQKYAAATNSPLPNDAKWGKASRPVINVSWEDAVKYTQWLSEQTDAHYRLPTEAEWEYFSRAGSTTDYWWGEQAANKMANCKRGCDSEYAGVFKGKTAPVGSYRANQFSVYDTAGNVAEWTLDCYEDHYVNAPTNGSALNNSQCKLRSVRGGSAKDNAKDIFSYSRTGLKENAKTNYVGFRVLREID